MSKVTPTTKSCNEICRLITGSGCNTWGKYVQDTFDPVSTHALYGITKDEVDLYKEKIKAIGGKYIRVVSNRHDKSNHYRVICFALEITPQEALAVKVEEEKKRKYEEALASKIQEIAISPMAIAVGATNEIAQKRFAKYLLDDSILDPLLPYEAYIILPKPVGKDENRIYDIVKKANAGCTHCVGMVTLCIADMVALAMRMNHAITDEDKRARRRAACLKYGLKFLAKCFEKRI